MCVSLCVSVCQSVFFFLSVHLIVCVILIESVSLSVIESCLFLLSVQKNQGILLGVVGTDIPLQELMKIIPKHMVQCLITQSDDALSFTVLIHSTSCNQLSLYYLCAFSWVSTVTRLPSLTTATS